MGVPRDAFARAARHVARRLEVVGARARRRFARRGAVPPKWPRPGARLQRAGTVPRGLGGEQRGRDGSRRVASGPCAASSRGVGGATDEWRRGGAAARARRREKRPHSRTREATGARARGGLCIGRAARVSAGATRGGRRGAFSGARKRAYSGVKSVRCRVLGNGRRETRTIWTWRFQRSGGSR